MEGCMGRVAWGGDGSMFRRSCEASNYGYVQKFDAESDKWNDVGKQLCFEVTADAEGDPWIVSKGNEDPVMKWDHVRNEWLNMGLLDAYNMAAGDNGHIYATAPPNKSGGQTLYRWRGG